MSPWGVMVTIRGGGELLLVVLVGHLPWFVDERGYIFGLYSVTLFVDAGHFLAGLLDVHFVNPVPVDCEDDNG